MKKLLLGVITIACVTIFSGSSFAAMSWDTCAIKRIGVSGKDAQLLKVTKCNKSSNNDKWLALVSQQDTSMATLLTALSLGKRVKLSADFANATTSGTAYGEVSVIYLDQ